MRLKDPQKKDYSKEYISALDAQRYAEIITAGPILFQVARLMIRFGVFEALLQSKNGLTMDEIAGKCGLSKYAAKILMEASLTARLVMCPGQGEDDRFTISKTGWFLQNNQATRVNMDFNHDVNYMGMFYLEESLLNGKPEGLKVLGDWDTIYEGLSSLPGRARESWFAFDHFYSDRSFDEALEIVFDRYGVRKVLDVGGNTGRWAMKCVEYSPVAQVTVMDLPQQIELMRTETAGRPGAERVDGHGVDLLDRNVPFPAGFDAIWMSQFLDCFSEPEIVSILGRAAASMGPGTKLFIMETFWDRQRFETASFCLTQISVYFTAMANGNSKMYHSEDMARCVEEAGLRVEEIYDGLGQGHSVMCCVKA